LKVETSVKTTNKIHNETFTARHSAARTTTYWILQQQASITYIVVFCILFITCVSIVIVLHSLWLRVLD